MVIIELNKETIDNLRKNDIKKLFVIYRDKIETEMLIDIKKYDNGPAKIAYIKSHDMLIINEGGLIGDWLKIDNVNKQYIGCRKKNGDYIFYFTFGKLIFTEDENRTEKEFWKLYPFSEQEQIEEYKIVKDDDNG